MGSLQSVPIVFVSSQKDDFTVDFLKFECENKNGKSKAECETISVLKKVIYFKDTYKEVKTKYLDALKPFEMNPLTQPIKKADDTRKFDFDFYKPTYTHYFKEKENSNLYQEVHEFDLTIGAPTISSEVVFDVTKSNPVSGLGKWVLNNIFKVDFAAGIKIGCSIGFDLGVNFPYYCDKGGANNDCYSGSTSFKGEIKASMTATPFVSVQAGYYFEASGEVEMPCNATINYVPEDASFNFKLSTKDVTLTPKFVIKENQTSQNVIFSFETEGWTIFKGGLIYEYNNKE